MPLPVRSPKLAARKLFSEEILLALPASHPFVSQFPPGALTFRELALLENETFIITRKNGKFAGVCLDICGSLFPPVNLIEINSLDTLYALIAKNTGVGFIPATLVRSEDLGKKIVCYRLKDLQARQTFVIARDPARELTAAAAEFIGVACGLFAGQPQTGGSLAAGAVPLPSSRQPGCAKCRRTRSITPSSAASPLHRKMRLIGIEPTHAAPEATALSTELQTHLLYNTTLGSKIQVFFSNFSICSHNSVSQLLSSCSFPAPVLSRPQHMKQGIHQKYRHGDGSRDLQRLRQVVGGLGLVVLNHVINAVVDGCPRHQGQNARHQENTSPEPSKAGPPGG